jgi:dinuclear metal center YbgI/SA1388 family protein
VSHHPFPFRAIKQLTTQTVTGRLLLQIITAGVAVHSPHTAFDSAGAGINQRLAEGLGLLEIRPLIDSSHLPDLGSGRWGKFANPCSVQECAQRLKAFLGISALQVVGRDDHQVETVAVACGSAGQFLHAASQKGCDLFVTGETTFHICLESQALEIAVLLPGHFASERFAVEQLAGVLARQFPAAKVWPSQCEADPLRWI